MRNPTRLARSLAHRVARMLLTGDFDHLKWKGGTIERPLAGFCYIACETVWHLMPEEERSHITPCHVQTLFGTHWFLRSDTGNHIDPTGCQFESCEAPDLTEGRGCGFQTKQPSMRASEIIDAFRREYL